MKRNKILFIIGLSFLLILVLGATYAYFSINVLDNSTDSSIMGTTNKYGTVIMKTETDKLYFNFLGDEMDIEYGNYENGTYYATNEPNGTMSKTKDIYRLATIKNTNSDISVDCTYKFKITASISKPITDGSDEDIYLGVDNKLYTLKEILESGENGLIHTGSTFGIENNVTRRVSFEAFIENSYSLQQDLVKNKFSFKVEPYKENGKSAISCKPHYIFKKDETFANNLINSGKLWQSNLEGDGYRYTFNEYDYSHIGNIVCFGVNTKEECLETDENIQKYAMLIVGVFPDEEGNNHVKLVKGFPEIESADSNDLTKKWKDTSLLSNLLTLASEYPESAIGKVTTWNWNTLDATENLNFAGISAKEIYNYEMNKSSIINVSTSREVVSSKIGLMYVSDFVLAYGDINKSYLSKARYIVEGKSDYWSILNPMSFSLICEFQGTDCLFLLGAPGDVFFAKSSNNGFVSNDLGYSWPKTFGDSNYLFLRPSFYLNSDVKVLSGDGTINDPYIIN